MGRLLCAGVIVGLVSVTSCGGDDARTQATGDTPPTAAEATGPEPSVSGKDPAAIIVSLDDPPSSWRAEPEPEGKMTAPGRVWMRSRRQSMGSARGRLRTRWRRRSPSQGPFLLAMVATSVDDVAASFDALVERLPACDGTTDAAGFTTLMEPLTFPTIGDEAFAVQADVANANGSKLSYILAESGR